MFAPVVCAVVRWVVLDHFYVGNQPDAGISSLNQIVAQERILRKPAVQNPMDGFDFIDAFTGEDPLAVKILVNVGDRTSVDIKTSLSRVNVCQARTGSAMHADSYPWLQNSVAGNHNVLVRI